MSARTLAESRVQRALVRLPRLQLPSTPWLVGGFVVVAMLLRIPFIHAFPMPDESGLLIVAGHWHDEGPQLYGRLFVDRPPGLLVFYWAAHSLGGITAARCLGLVLVAGLVTAAGRVGWLLGGRRGAVWAAAVAAALSCNPATGGVEINAELIGVPFIVGGAALAVDAIRREHRPWVRRLLLVSAGVLAATAPTVKQNLLDGVVFVVVLVVAQSWWDRWGRRRGLAALGLVAGGALLPVLGLVVWSTVQAPGPAVLWDTLFHFRVLAGKVLSSDSSGASSTRLQRLPMLALMSGLVPLVVAGSWLERRRLTHPTAVATMATLLVEGVGVLLGGSYWPHYLIALVPGVVLLAAGAASTRVPRWPMVLAVAFALGSSIVITFLSVGDRPLAPGHARERAVTSWVKAARQPGDTGLVTYGQAQVLQSSGLRPGYAYLWSLPVRALDPNLERLVRDVRSPHSPDWIVEWMPVDTWGLDSSGDAQRAIDHYYREVGTVCDVPIYLRADLHRALPPVPAGCTVTR